MLEQMLPVKFYLWNSSDAFFLSYFTIHKGNRGRIFLKINISNKVSLQIQKRKMK